MNDVKEFASPRGTVGARRLHRRRPAVDRRPHPGSSRQRLLDTRHLGRGIRAALRRYLGAKHGVAVNSGTSALEIIFRALGVEGRDVLVPANINYGTVAAVVHAGGRPVGMDTEAETLGTAPEEVERCITPNTAGFPWLLPNSPAQPSS